MLTCIIYYNLRIWVNVRVVLGEWKRKQPQDGSAGCEVYRI